MTKESQHTRARAENGSTTKLAKSLPGTSLGVGQICLHTRSPQLISPRNSVRGAVYRYGGGVDGVLSYYMGAPAWYGYLGRRAARELSMAAEEAASASDRSFIGRHDSDSSSVISSHRGHFRCCYLAVSDKTDQPPCLSVSGVRIHTAYGRRGIASSIMIVMCLCLSG